MSFQDSEKAITLSMLIVMPGVLVRPLTDSISTEVIDLLIFNRTRIKRTCKITMKSVTSNSNKTQ